MEEDIDLFFIPSIWPETFSYTTSEIMSMHMPVAVFPIGAPVERVKYYEKGLVLKETDAKSALKELQEFAEHTLHCQEMPVREKKILFVGEEISFASRYRVEHFRNSCTIRVMDLIFIRQMRSQTLTGASTVRSYVTAAAGKMWYAR